MKNFFAILIVAGIFTFIGYLVINHYNDSNVETDSDYSFEMNNRYENLPEGFEDNQSKAGEISSKFIEYLINNRSTYADDKTYSVNGICSVDYPEFFAGTYINTDGKLIIQVTESYYDDNYRKSDWYSNLTEIVKSEEFACHPVKYSYRKLIESMTNLLWGNISTKLKSEGIQISASGINDYENCIYVYINSDVDVNKVESILDSDIFKIEVGEMVLNLDTVTLNPGKGITRYSTGTQDFSMACRARRYNTISGEYEYGFLTCGHAFSGTTNVYLSGSGTYLGSCNAAVQKNSGTVDAAFVSTASGVNVSDVVDSENVTLYNTYSTDMGSVVYKRGDATQTQGGIVSSSSYYYNLNGVNFTDFVQASYYSQGGDSGGIVYKQPDSSNHAYSIGIHSGHYATNGNNCVYSFFCKISNALNGLQIPFIYVYLY